MTKSDSTVRALARQLLALEAATGPPDELSSDTIVRVCEKLRIILTRLAGANGYAALLRRALAMARVYHPELESVIVTDDGRFEGLKATRTNPRNEEPALLTIVACLLELLIAFVGEGLTRKLISDAWPDQSLDAQNQKD